jgi:hypothetical protein
MEFFSTSSKNLVAAAQSAGVGHYVALSIVNCDGLPESGYMRAKVGPGTDDHRLRVAVHDRARRSVSGVRRGHHRVAGGGRRRAGPRWAYPADCRHGRVLRSRSRGTGRSSQRHRRHRRSGEDELRRHRARRACPPGHDEPVIIDPPATYFGTPVDESSLVTGEGAVIATTRFADWLAAR